LFLLVVVAWCVEVVLWSGVVRWGFGVGCWWR
jgi:hypothetical protein